MNIVYRISDNGYSKEKPEYISNEKCLSNFCSVFSEYLPNIHILADKVTDDTFRMIEGYTPPSQIERTDIGHGALVLNHHLKRISETQNIDPNSIFYFIEDDYLHKPLSPKVIEDGFDIGLDYVSVYDHPDKYLNPIEGGNPFCSGRSEETRVYLGKYSHYKLTNSMTMTFAVKFKTIMEDMDILLKWTSERHPSNYPYDFHMFRELVGVRGRRIGSSIPGYSTHGETRWLSPLTDWGSV
jgi:hypothetical protein